jgi:hypothetical protein
VWTYCSTHSLTSALYGVECSVSRSGRFTSRERAPGTRWIVGWVGSKAVLDAVLKRKIPSPCRKSNPRTPIVQPVAQQGTIFRAYICYFMFAGNVVDEYPSLEVNIIQGCMEQNTHVKYKLVHHSVALHELYFEKFHVTSFCTAYSIRTSSWM